VLGEGECALGTIPDDVDAQEPLGRTQVTKLEVLTQLLLHSLDGICHLSSNVQVVHTGRDNHLVSLAVKHIDTRLTAHFDESQLLHDLAELEVPLPASLLKAIDGLPEEAVELLTCWVELLKTRVASCTLPPPGWHVGRQW
jgi:hypothetical protein